MKKFAYVIAMLVVFIIIYFLQSNFFSWFTIAGVSPNLFVMLALFMGLFMGKTYGIVISLALGLSLDLLIGRVIRHKRYCYGTDGVLRDKAK